VYRVVRVITNKQSGLNPTAVVGAYPQLISALGTQWQCDKDNRTVQQHLSRMNLSG